MSAIGRHRHLLVVATGAALLVPAAGALAHTEIAATSPKAGAVVRNLPATVALTFGDPIGRVTSVRVLRGASDRATGARRDPGNAARVLVTTKQNAPGAYRVQWAIVGTDGHRQSGEFGFRVRR